MSVLVDSSVWIDHLHKSDPVLESLLLAGLVLVHPAIVGELACGSIKYRQRFLASLIELPRLPMADFEEVMHLIESEPLWGKGLGWMDAHLLTSARNHHILLWTKDRALNTLARQSKLAFIAS